jgi:trigger factor
MMPNFIVCAVYLDYLYFFKQNIEKVEVNLKDLENCKKEFEAVLSYDDLVPHFDDAILKYKQKVQIPGFRKGKAPLQIVKKMYGDSIEYSALEDIANETFKNYVVENNIQLIGTGSLIDLDYKPKEKFTFKVEFEIIPEFTLENYKGFELSKINYVIDDSLAEDELKQIKLKMAQFELDGEALDEEYMITIDMQELDNTGSPIIGNSTKDMRIYLADKYLEKDFKSALKNIRENEEKTIETKNPKGEQMKVKITAKKIEKIVYPEMNIETLKKITGKDDIKTEEELLKFIKTELQSQYDEVSLSNLRDAAMKELVKSNDISVPNYYVNMILDDYYKDYQKKHTGHTHHKHLTEEEFKKENRADAIFNAKWYLIKDKFIEQEKIEVSDDDFKKFAEKNASMLNIPVEKLVEIYKNNADLKFRLLSNKVLDIIVENAKVTEVEEVKKLDTITE